MNRIYIFMSQLNEMQSQHKPVDATKWTLDPNINQNTE